MIRPAVPGDSAAITALVEQAYAVYVPRIGLRPAPMDADHAGEIARGQAFVIDRDDAIAGVIVLVTADDHLMIENVAVEPSCQGQGVGTQLLEFATGYARRLVLPEIRLYTHELMTENIAFYRRLGFHEVERRREHGFARVFFTRPV